MKPVIISKQAEFDFEEVYKESKEEFGETVANKLFSKFCHFRHSVAFYLYAYGYYYRSKFIRKFILTKSILVLYRVSRKHIEIIAVVYAKQNPVKIKRNIRKRE